MAKTKKAKIKEFEERLVKNDKSLRESDIKKYLDLVEIKLTKKKRKKVREEADQTNKIFVKEFAKFLHKKSVSITITNGKYGIEFINMVYLSFIASVVITSLTTVQDKEERMRMMAFIVKNMMRDVGVDLGNIEKKITPLMPKLQEKPNYIG